MEYQISVSIFAWYRIGPQFFHEEHLVGELWGHSISCWSRFSYPVCQMTDEVEEEIAFRNGDYLYMDEMSFKEIVDLRQTDFNTKCWIYLLKKIKLCFV